MTTVPKYAIIGPHRVAIEYVPEEGMGDTVGRAEFRKNKISISTGLASSMGVETLLHEVVHFLLCGVPLKERDAEGVANILGKGLTSFVRDNPQWMQRFREIFAKEENE